MKEQYQEER